MLYISHDLLSVASICHRIAILHEGDIVECSRTEEILESPQHPYTRKLIAALPQRPAPARVLQAKPMVVHKNSREFSARR
jgi:ABC-type dipeptide/oligopeptide/nickel transport system ATPase component